MKADLLTQVILPLSLIIIMFGMGLSLRLADFVNLLKQPKAIIIGIFCQMIALPLVGFSIIMLFDLPPELAVGVMILAFCPGGSTSNMMTYLARGDVALSISLTAIVSVITPFTIPLLTAWVMTLLLSESAVFEIPILKTIIQLFVITLLPVLVGMVIHYKYSDFARRTEKPIKIFSIIFLFVIILGIVAKNLDKMAEFFILTGVASLSLNLIGLLLGFIFAKLMQLNKSQAISIGIEVGIQNGTMALLVTSTLLSNTTMAIPAVTYSLMMFATGATFGWLINRT